jgi:hypothetical protein
MEEVDEKTQAELAIKLSDSVRELVREHLKEALQDFRFLHSVYLGYLADELFNNQGRRHLEGSLTQIIMNKMQR